jgi:hypothetical protein
MNQSFPYLIVMAVLAAIVWFVSNGSIYLLVFSGVILISYLILNVTQAICSFGNDSRAILAELIQINENLNTLINDKLNSTGYQADEEE